ncbi:chitobiosyldiphosphodolichol beta-mannosyltransferase-like [Halichondria panicea]|uniref:chitobiosyldiphosphodolichol beta-mannosyltransferase-like n=1 Tax=Halichondria panicea TaxID=6063 RepID=UPI00312BBC09
MVDILGLLFACLFLMATFGLSVLLLATVRWRGQTGQGLVQVVVLGDAGRSPRMLYHCLSLVQLSYTIDLIGYGGSPLIRELRESGRLTHTVLWSPPALLDGLPRILRYALKALYQTMSLLWAVLIATKKPSHVLVQTPPAIPTLAVMVLACAIRGSKLIVDYHNYGHTILALSLGRKHTLVLLAKWYEKLTAGFSFANLCVSEAMKKDMRRSLGVRSIVLYDRPPARFHQATVEQRHQLFLRLSESEAVFRGEGGGTRFTREVNGGVAVLRRDRPFFLISSTSWTEDEDFGILLQALEIYEGKCSQVPDGSLPHILCVITGKGPLREHYEQCIAKKNFSHVTIKTIWLSAEDYPLMLGSADLGVCLHKSSSGLDLPMKVVDMFGSGLPVCAINFNCLHELLRHHHNGLVFNDHQELAEQLQTLSTGFPDQCNQLVRYRENLSSFQSLRWDHYWKLHVLPLIAPQS